MKILFPPRNRSPNKTHTQHIIRPIETEIWRGGLVTYNRSDNFHFINRVVRAWEHFVSTSGQYVKRYFLVVNFLFFIYYTNHWGSEPMKMNTHHRQFSLHFSIYINQLLFYSFVFLRLGTCEWASMVTVEKWRTQTTIIGQRKFQWKIKNKMTDYSPKKKKKKKYTCIVSADNHSRRVRFFFIVVCTRK